MKELLTLGRDGDYRELDVSEIGIKAAFRKEGSFDPSRIIQALSLASVNPASYRPHGASVPFNREFTLNLTESMVAYFRAVEEYAEHWGKETALVQDITIESSRQGSRVYGIVQLFTEVS